MTFISLVEKKYDGHEIVAANDAIMSTLDLHSPVSKIYSMSCECLARTTAVIWVMQCRIANSACALNVTTFYGGS